MIANSYSFTVNADICLSSNIYNFNIPPGFPIEDMTHISPLHLTFPKTIY
jgi:hypothetical protein